MKVKIGTTILIILFFLLTACGGAPMSADTMPPAELSNSGQADAPSAAEAGAPAQDASVTYEIGTGATVSDGQTSTRMIIKDANVTLQVADTDVAVDGVTQVAGDTGGYIISSRVWYQDTYGVSQKYASITIGVPADQFEFAMRRLRGMAVKVLDETASGEDVTDQYVDLQSQLKNLEATRDRILTFLEDAKTVNEALQVNQELTKIEQQIEEIKGRINYLQNRSAYSTIAVTLTPQPPEIVPTLTPTPTPTATPVPWKPGETVDKAGNTLVVIYQFLIELLIWILVVLVPLIAPPVLIVWGIWYFVKRRKKKTTVQKEN
jgi:hypothetical protein